MEKPASLAASKQYPSLAPAWWLPQGGLPLTRAHPPACDPPSPGPSPRPAIYQCLMPCCTLRKHFKQKELRDSPNPSKAETGLW